MFYSLIIFFGFVSIISGIISSNSDKLTSNSSLVPTFDIYHHFLGYNLRSFFRFWWIPDSLLLMTIVFVCFLQYKEFEQFIYELCILQIIRILACVSTVGYVSPRYFYNRCHLGFTNNCFSDLYISGHSLTATLIWCFMYDKNLSFIWYSLITLIAFLAVVSNLLVGDHYTADIRVGVSLAMAVHW